MEQFEAREVPASSISIANASFAEGDSGSSLLNFTVSRSGDLDSELRVSYATADGTALAGVDYTATSDSFIYPAGAATATISIPVSGNLLLEGDREFSLQLTDVSPSVAFDRQTPTAETGTMPFAVAIGDLDGNGKPDLAIANSLSNNVSVILNTTAAGAAPTFALPQTMETKQTPRSVAIADINGDGKADLVVTNFSSNCVSVMLNTTAAGAAKVSFALQQTFATGSTPSAVVVTDLNGDGKLDLVIANQSSANVSVLMNATTTGAAEPAFADNLTFGTRSGPSSVAVADLNGDGKLDLAVANLTANCVSVLLNNTASSADAPSFAGQKTFEVGALPVSVVAGDLNGDGKLDLAVANLASNSLSVFVNKTAPGNATLSFEPQKTFATGSSPRTLVIGDVNGDSKPDLAVAAQGSDELAVLINTTTANTPVFSSQQTFSTGPQPFATAFSDINADGKLDIVVTNREWNCAAVMLNKSLLTATTPIITIAKATATGAIRDDDAPPTLQLSATSAYAPPGTAFTLPTIIVKNAAGVSLPNVKVIFTVGSSGGATAAFPGDATTATVMTTEEGVAAPPTLTANTTSGAYPLTIDAQDTSGSTAASVAVPLANAVPTTTTLTATPNASTGGALVTFKATVAPSPGLLGTVSFLDKGLPITGGTNVALVGGVATFQISTLTSGAHPITAVFAGATGFATSTSSPLIFGVASADAPPKVISVVTNGNIAGLAGPQRSRVASLVVTFDQPVRLDADALLLALDTKNVSYGGILQEAGYGALPTSLHLASTDQTSWLVTFVGNTENGVDGINSLKDGVYDLNINGARVHPLGDPSIAMGGNSTTTFHRLFGDVGTATTPVGGSPGVDFQAIINAGDNFAFRSDFNNPANYRAFLDYNGDGAIGSTDNFQFRGRFNKPLIWRV